MRPEVVRLAALGGFFAPVVGLSMVGLAISQAPWFSWTKNALSDLGVGATAPIFNAGLIAAGLIAIVFAVGLGKRVFNDTLGNVGTIALLSACVSLVLIGVFSEDAGRIHYWVSVSFFVSMPISMLIFAAAMSLADLKTNLAYVVLTVVLALIAAAAWALPHDGVAIPEIVSSVAGSTWFFVFAWRLQASHGA